MAHNFSDHPRSVICLTPVKNEEWILHNSLSANSLWADRIIVADQFSTDRSREICRSFEKVTLIANPNANFNEPERQNLLIETARSFPEPSIFIALDADEILSANFSESSQWAEALKQPPGTVIEFLRVSLWEDINTCFNVGYYPCGYVDGGQAHQGTTIHSNRVPILESASRFRVDDVALIHFQFCNMPRMRSKHRWYRCYERITFPQKSADSINLMYSWMYRNDRKLETPKSKWFEMYNRLGIKFDKYADTDNYWWDWEILRMFEVYGQNKFEDIEIWDIDWEQIRQCGIRLEEDGLPQRPINQSRVMEYF